MDYYLIIAIVIGVVVLLAVAGIIIFLIRRKNKIKQAEEFPHLLEAFGGSENINQVTYKGSRVSVIVENKKLVDKEKIKEEGVETIVVSNKKFTLVVGNKQALLISNYLTGVKESI